MGSDLQVCLSHKVGWGNKPGRGSNSEPPRAILESVWGDGLPATGHAKAVAGTVVKVLWAREVSWSKPMELRQQSDVG